MNIFKIYYDYCIQSNKFYIGYTKSSWSDRWYNKCHKAKSTNLQYKLLNAIRMYPDDSWEHGYIYCSNSLDHILQMEIYFISKYNSYENGYNSTLGGEVPMNSTLSTKHKSNISYGLKLAYETGNRLPVSHNNKVRSKISNSKSTGIWKTPYGNFKSSNIAAKECNTTRPTLTKICRNPNTTVTEYLIKMNPSILSKADLGKTYSELGFGFIPNSD